MANGNIRDLLKQVGLRPDRRLRPAGRWRVSFFAGKSAADAGQLPDDRQPLLHVGLPAAGADLRRRPGADAARARHTHPSASATRCRPRARHRARPLRGRARSSSSTCCGGLLVLTVIEVLLAYIHVPLTIMLTILIGLSLIKAAMIIAYFMHLRVRAHEPRADAHPDAGHLHLPALHLLPRRLPREGDSRVAHFGRTRLAARPAAAAH